MLPSFLPLPAGTKTACCLYVENDLLVMHLNKTILKFRAGQAEKLVEDSRISTEETVLEPSSQPVVNAAFRVYYIVKEDKCYCIDMDTGIAGPGID